MADPLITAASGLAGKLIGGLISSLKKPVANKISEWQTPARIRALGKKLAQFEQVKTLSNPEKPQKISDFYSTPKFSYANGRPFSVNKITDFGIEDHPLIEGIAGQGKSIFMRHLFIEEIKTGERLPILIELRKISQEEKLLALIVEQLKSLGFPEPESVWNHLAATGKAALLLDGFDELTEIFRSPFLTDIQNLIITYPELKIAITTRPEAAIRGVAFFRTVKIQPLDHIEREELIKKLCSSQSAQSLLAGLKKNNSLFKMVDTPLFITLLCVAYRAEQYIPETTHEFYDLVFNTLLYRHDAFKQGFDRPRKSELGNHQFCKVFESFCFYSFREQIVRMNEEKANTFISEALKNENISSTNSDKYFSDLVKITCLLIQDGNEFQFLHKSIQDYFCAKYIKRLPDNIAEQLYQKVLSSRSLIGQFTQTLKFLKGIDEYRYFRFFETPAISYVLFGDFNKKPTSFSKSLTASRALRFLGEKNIFLHFKKLSGAKTVRWGITHLDATPLPSLINFFSLDEIVCEAFFQKEFSNKILAGIEFHETSEKLKNEFQDFAPGDSIIVNAEETLKKLGLKREFLNTVKSLPSIDQFNERIAFASKLTKRNEALARNFDLI